MPSSPTQRNRVEKGAFKEKLDLWAEMLAGAFDRFDEASDASFVAGAAVALSDFAGGDGHKRVMRIPDTASGTTIDLPGNEKLRLVFQDAPEPVTLRLPSGETLKLATGAWLVHATGTEFLVSAAAGAAPPAGAVRVSLDGAIRPDDDGGSVLVDGVAVGLPIAVSDGFEARIVNVGATPVTVVNGSSSFHLEAGRFATLLCLGGRYWLT